MANENTELSTGFGNGRSVVNEPTIKIKLKDMLGSDSKVYFILWKYAPHLMPKEIDTFEDLTKTYKTFRGINEKRAINWLAEENVQTAVKWLMNRLHQQKMIELYNLYYEKAKEDTQAFKAFIDFSDRFFANNQDNELLAMLRGIDEKDLIE